MICSLSATLLEECTRTETSRSIVVVHLSLQWDRCRGKDHLFCNYYCNCCNSVGEPPQTDPELQIYGAKHDSGKGYRSNTT